MVATSPDAERALTFAVVSSSPETARQLAAVCAEVESALSRPVIPRVLPSYETLKEEVAAGEAALVWAPPLVAIGLESAGSASIDLCCTRGGQADYHAALFTRHASDLETLADLKDRHAAWVDANSSAGYLLPRMKIRAEGMKLDGLFARESFLGTHARVACAVLAGEADAGATYLILDAETRRPVSAGWLEAGAGINGAHILATAGPIPSDAIAISSRVDAELKKAIVECLKALPAKAPEAVGELFHADGFVAPSASHFDALRALAKTGDEG